jgi:radical SAM protein with 4Fe4S-binding SPASM domain
MCYYFGETGVYNQKKIKRKPETLNMEKIKEVIRYLTPANPRYSLFGGEPLVYPHLEELILEIKKANCFVDTPTNGTLLEQYAEMLVETKFDSIRVSLDGPRKQNDIQRGKGSFDKAINGIEALVREKKKQHKRRPELSIIYTVTQDNYDSIEELFLKDLNLDYFNWITIQMQNFITEEMGEEYARFLKKEFDIQNSKYWRGLIRKPHEFDRIDRNELSRQIKKVKEVLKEKSKYLLLLPPSFSPENLDAYLKARWSKMSDRYRSCIVPWLSADIVANGDVAPCHVFFDLVMGNIYENSFQDIWFGKNYQKFRNYITQNNFMPICPGCCILYLTGKKVRRLNPRY